jgi:UDP-glucose 4-epimerase
MLTSSSRVLITGANGFIGAVLSQELLNMGCFVRTLTREPYTASMDNWTMDLGIDECPQGLMSGIDTVFHLAGIAHELSENQQETLYQRVNTEGTFKLLVAAQRAQVQKFVYFSSVKAAGDTGAQCRDETFCVPPNSPYGRSKLAAEQLVLSGGFIPHPVVIRPCMVYGDTNKGNLPKMINAINQGFFPPIPENNNKRSMVHVHDVVRAAWLTAESVLAAKEIFIVSDKQTYSTRRIYDWTRSLLGKAPRPWTIPMPILQTLAKSGDVVGQLQGRPFFFDSDALHKLTGSAHYSSDKIERLIGFTPHRNLQESLPEIIRHLGLI